MPNKSGARGIHTAASKGHVAVVNSLIVKGENVDAATNVNISPELQRNWVKLTFVRTITPPSTWLWSQASPLWWRLSWVTGLRSTSEEERLARLLFISPVGLTRPRESSALSMWPGQESALQSTVSTANLAGCYSSLELTPTWPWLMVGLRYILHQRLGTLESLDFCWRMKRISWLLMRFDVFVLCTITISSLIYRMARPLYTKRAKSATLTFSNVW